jgi:tRNA threonylcarbamoyladenosine biosynthesis protein TsaB
MKWLGVSTSTRRGSVAVMEGDRILSHAPYEDLKGHAERIVLAVESTLAEAGITRGDLDALACDVGPGSFTGSRVGVAFTKGVALALELPVIGVSSLEAMAKAAFRTGRAATDDLVVPILDAKKGEVFLAAYGDRGLMLPPRHVRREAAWQAVHALAEAHNLVVVGEIAAELGALSPHLVTDPELDLPDASWIIHVAAERWASASEGSSRFDAGELEPTYVRAPDATPT